MVRFRVFAMYVRTELVHTYIVKRPSFLLYSFLAVPKMGTATSIIKIWVGDSPTPCWLGKGVVKHDIHLTWPFRYVRMYEARTDASGERLQRA